MKLLQAISERCKQWFDENVCSDGFQPYYPISIVVESRYLEDILDGLTGEGFVYNEDYTTIPSLV